MKQVSPAYYADLKDAQLSARRLAHKWGVGKTTITDDRKRLREDNLYVKENNDVQEVKEESSDGSKAIEFIRTRPVTLEDAREWIRSTGDNPDDYELSVRSIAYGKDQSSNRMAARPKNRKQAVELPTADELYAEAQKLFEQLEKPSPPSKGEHSLVVGLSDLQLGKTDEKGDTSTTMAHLRRALSVIEEYLKNRVYISDVYIIDGGDIIEGFTNVNSQTYTNDLTLTEQVRLARRIVLDYIHTLATLGVHVHYVTVPSNHCGVRSGVGRDKVVATSDDDWGLEISHQLEDIIRHAGLSTEQVTFHRPEKYEENLAVTLPSGNVLGVVHGHQFNNADKVTDWWQKADHGRYPVSGADILLFGHHHNFSIRQSGNSRWAICLPSADNGSAWFRNKSGQSAQRGVLMFENSSELPWSNLQIL